MEFNDTRGGNGMHDVLLTEAETPFQQQKACPSPPRHVACRIVRIAVFRRNLERRPEEPRHRRHGASRVRGTHRPDHRSRAHPRNGSGIRRDTIPPPHIRRSGASSGCRRPCPSSSGPRASGWRRSSPAACVRPSCSSASRSRSRPAAGSRQRRRHRALPADAATRERHRQDHDAADARDVLALRAQPRFSQASERLFCKTAAFDSATQARRHGKPFA